MKRGKNGNVEETRRALQYKEDGQGNLNICCDSIIFIFTVPYVDC